MHTLHLYGAAGIVAFGGAMGTRCGFDFWLLAPLWFCGALLVYNADRLKTDPTDAVNTPGRVERHARWRRSSFVVAVTAAAFLLLWPVLLGAWQLLALVVLAGVVSLSYSFPLPGFRFKDVPLVKTLFAPTIVTVACFLPPLLARALDAGLALAIAWAWLYLMFNMLLCDLRDFEGDRAAGTLSLPVVLGKKRTRGVLCGSIGVLAVLALAKGWPALALISSAYLGGTLVALRRPRGEAFYEWVAEGMLFVPLLANLVTA